MLLWGIYMSELVWYTCLHRHNVEYDWNCLENSNNKIQQSHPIFKRYVVPTMEDINTIYHHRYTLDDRYVWVVINMILHGNREIYQHRHGEGNWFKKDKNRSLTNTKW